MVSDGKQRLNAMICAIESNFSAWSDNVTRYSCRFHGISSRHGARRMGACGLYLPCKNERGRRNSGMDSCEETRNLRVAVTDRKEKHGISGKE